MKEDLLRSGPFNNSKQTFFMSVNVKLNFPDKRFKTISFDNKVNWCEVTQNPNTQFGVQFVGDR